MEFGARVTALITGPPGGGKGTISKRLRTEFGFQHLSSGDLLREQADEGTDLGLRAREYMDRGDLVPDELLVDLIFEKIQDLEPVRPGGLLKVLLDGFPRTLKQALTLEEKVEIAFVLNLEVPTEEIVERISDRFVHPHSGRVYSFTYNPPKEKGKDDITGEPLIRRADDEPDKIRKRLETYGDATLPLLKHYESKGLLYSFDGNSDAELILQNRRSDAIYADLKKVVNEKLEEFERTHPID